MSDTTVGLPQVADGVAAYVREVRAELADLPVEDVDDLIGGMEADLSELAAESGGELVGRLGSPSLYAAELRAAAGVPERVAGSNHKRRPLREIGARVRVRFASLTERYPWLLPVADLLVAIRPAWWVLRGYVVAWALWSTFGGRHDGVRLHSVLEIIMALAAIVLSVQVGRGWLRERVRLRPLIVAANVVAVFLALLASLAGTNSYYYTNASGPPQALTASGTQVVNIYTYDSAGNRLTGVRLFDQDGRPLVGDMVYDLNGNPIAGVRDGSGASVFNVYPRALTGPDAWQVTDPANPELHPDVWTPPVSIVPLTPDVTPSGTQTGTPGGAPTGTSATSAPKATSSTTAGVPVPSATSTSQPVLPKPGSSTPSTPPGRPSPSVARSAR